jgi:hypothetical protein
MARMNRTKKTLLIIAGCLVGLVVLVIVFISPIAKYAIEKYDQQLLGREITLDFVYLNPFTGYVHLNGVVITEADPIRCF